jgi:hypothetical protein
LDDAIHARQKKREHIIPFGIDYLDDATHGGIMRGDLVLLGAQAGRGKTQCATLIGLNAALLGKKVFYFALEAERSEITHRILLTRMRCPVSAGKYMAGVTNSQILAEEKRAADSLREINNFMIMYKSQNFGVKDLHRNLLSYQNDADLFIVDHFHFLDTHGEQSELREQKEAVKLIRDIALDIGKPVILIAHLNKAYAKSDKPPSMYDFYGTSELPNVCTKAVLITGNIPTDLDTSLSSNSRLWPTLFTISKQRVDSTATNYYGLTYFDAATSKYTPGYHLAHVPSKKVINRGDVNFPDWAERAIEPRPYSNEWGVR